MHRCPEQTSILHVDTLFQFVFLAHRKIYLRGPFATWWCFTSPRNSLYFNLSLDTLRLCFSTSKFCILPSRSWFCKILQLHIELLALFLRFPADDDTIPMNAFLFEETDLTIPRKISFNLSAYFSLFKERYTIGIRVCPFVIFHIAHGSLVVTNISTWSSTSFNFLNHIQIIYNSCTFSLSFITFFLFLLEISMLLNRLIRVLWKYFNIHIDLNVRVVV